jgi:5-methylcytosine-specific restriction protein A
MPRRAPTYRAPSSVPPTSSTRAYRTSPGRRALEELYNSKRWRRFRAAYLLEHPPCEECLKQGRTTAAQQVHHKIDLKTIATEDLLERAFEWDGLAALCIGCHNAMRAKESPPSQA